MNCHDCLRYKTPICYTNNPQAQDWDMAENYSCFLPAIGEKPSSASAPVSIPSPERKHKIQVEDSGKSDTYTSRSWLKKLLIGLGSVIGIFILIAIIALVTNSEKPPLTSAERAYSNTTTDQVISLSNALTELAELFQNPQIDDDQWTRRLATQIVIIQKTYDEAIKLDPPSSQEQIHHKYIQALEYYNDSTYLLIQWLDEQDSNLIAQATKKLVIGAQLFEEATALVLEFEETRK
ncbi:hypothetical protein ACFLTP_01860 [Chloroflexota bacterium]